jgi:dTDP-4-dehydrorhamnose reductase
MFSKDLIKRRILVAGSNGMLGLRTVDFFSKQQNVEVLGCSIEDKSITNNYEYICCDLTKKEKIKKVAYDFYPDFIINAAALTNVDLSETERENAWRLNVKAVEYLAEIARVLDSHLIHISSDYIFDGTNGPYAENAKPNPLGYYGRTKLASENALKISGAVYTILRTNVLYGIASNRLDFVRWTIKSLKENKQINIVTDQYNNPTFIDDLVQAISKVIEFRKDGIYHIGGRDFLSRFDFSKRIADFFKLDSTLIKPIGTEELNQKARRPLKSGLITLKAETELGYKPHTLAESFGMMKKELSL